jgi:hypothetical protein
MARDEKDHHPKPSKPYRPDGVLLAQAKEVGVNIRGRITMAFLMATIPLPGEWLHP